MRCALHKRNTARGKFVTEILSRESALSFFSQFGDDYHDVSDEQNRKSQHRKKRNQSQNAKRFVIRRAFRKSAHHIENRFFRIQHHERENYQSYRQKRRDQNITDIERRKTFQKKYEQSHTPDGNNQQKHGINIIRRLDAEKHLRRNRMQNRRRRSHRDKRHDEKIRPISRAQGSHDKPQKQRQSENVNQRTDAQMLPKPDARIIPVTPDADNPRA